MERVWGGVYFIGFCDNVLVNGSQSDGCLKGGCGIICKRDSTPGPSPPNERRATMTLVIQWDRNGSADWTLHCTVYRP